MKPTRETIKQFIGKNVKVVFYDSCDVTGILEEYSENKYCICPSFWDRSVFKVSHIKSIEEMDKGIVCLKKCMRMVKNTRLKETPKKVETEPFYQTGDCPCCKSTVGRLDIYCRKCGQKLDWSEE